MSHRASSPLLHRRRVLTALVVGAALAVTGGIAPSLASPATPTITAGAGWLRLGHLSPDTKAVDVRVSALSGGATLFELHGVAYGAVSGYTELAAGTYAVSMVPAGAASTAKPVLSASVDVLDGSATTIAAYGANKNLQVKAFTDDLTTPTAGTARVRLIQASTRAATVDVETSTGLTIANNARRGTATRYAEIPAGPWTLELTATSSDGTAQVDVAVGSVTTLFVLDTAAGDLTILPILDSAAVGAVPIGGLVTGGGWSAEHPTLLGAVSAG